MSFNLSALLKARNITSWVDPLLEKGTVYLYQNNQYNYEPEICFRPPGPGTAILEAWGAGGSSSCNCCCGPTMPPNPGAYAKKYICYNGDDYLGSYICGRLGIACYQGNCQNMCSQAVCLKLQYKCCSCPDSCCSCLCVEGGYGGRWYCGEASLIALINNQSYYLNYNCGDMHMSGNGDICEATIYNNCCQMHQAHVYQCGKYTICENDIYQNARPSIEKPYGQQLPNNEDCCNMTCISVPGGYYSEKQAYIRHTHTCSCCNKAQGAYDNYHQKIVGRWHGGVEGHHLGSQEDTKHHLCFCYDAIQTCYNTFPPGFPGPNLGHCHENFRTQGMRGGNGGVRITWIKGE